MSQTDRNRPAPSSAVETTAFGACPAPVVEKERILLAHGGGGKLSARLVEDVVVPALRNPVLERLDDQALLNAGDSRLAFTTDSFVVTPLFFPGGDIGELAVNGTVNDLAVGGARPLALSLALIIEEGFGIEDLRRVLASIGRAATRAGVSVVTGDTKVVGRGSADKLFITTSGVGIVPEGRQLSASRIRPGDAILLSGSIGDHGTTIMSRREGLSFEGDLASDTAPLNDLVETMLGAWPDVHAMRDPTRGGVAATLVEMASRQRVGIDIREGAAPVQPGVRGACELLGLDPLFVANEGKLVAFVPEEGMNTVLAAMRRHPLGRDSVCLGHVTVDHPGVVVVQTLTGSQRVLDLPLGEALPRIC